MKNFYLKSFMFWFVLLAVAILNAVIRETTYKPLLTPHLGSWAHQISSLTGIFLFSVAIYFFLKNIKAKYTPSDLVKAGLIWIGLTLVFESWMNLYVRHLTLQQVLETYYFWKGDTWIFVLLSLGFLPSLINRIFKLQT